MRPLFGMLEGKGDCERTEVSKMIIGRIRPSGIPG